MSDQACGETPGPVPRRDARLAAELAAAHAAIARQDAAIRRLQDTIVASRHDVERARAEVAGLGDGAAHEDALRHERDWLAAEASALRAALADARAAVAAIQGSVSWRITGPLRAALTRAYRLRARMSGPPPESLPPPGPAGEDGRTLTVEALHALSRDR